MKRKIFASFLAIAIATFSFSGMVFANDTDDATATPSLVEDGILIEGENVVNDEDYLTFQKEAQAVTTYASSSYDLSKILDSNGQYNGYDVYTETEAAEYCIDLIKDHQQTIDNKFLIAVTYNVSDIGSGSPYTYAYNAYNTAFSKAFNDSLFIDGKGGDYLLYSMYGRPFYVTSSCKYFTDGDNGVALVYATPGKAYYYTTASEEQTFTKKAASVVSSLKSSASTDYEKVCAVFDYICDNVTYDYDNLGKSNYYTIYTAYGALCNGTAVCQGYANLFYYLLNELGVPCRIVAGEAYNGSTSGAHAWNIVKLDGTWYHVDSTWGASYSKWYSGRYFFLQSEQNFVNGHAGTKHVMDYMTGIQTIDYTSSDFLSAYPISQVNDYCVHSYSLVSSKAASCGVKGYEIYACSKCGETYEETIPALQHNYVITSETAATCTTQGLLNEKCSNCGKTRTETTGSLGHNYVVKEKVDATCDTYGYTIYECSRCGHEHEDNLVQAYGHNYELTDHKAMTHTSDGYDTYTCSVCGKTYTETHEAEPEHSWSEDYSIIHISLSCEDDIEVTCTICGETKVEDSHLHKWIHYDAVEATCLEDGHNEYDICKYCGYIKGNGEIEVTKARGSHWGEAIPAKEPTCTQDGYSAHRVCVNCGEALSEFDVYPATGHTADPDQILGPNYRSDTECAKCAVCGAVMGHTAPDNAVVTKEPTCTEPGYRNYTCTICGDYIENEEIPALGHEFNSEPTCTEGVTCVRCGYTTPPAGHDWEILYEDTCYADGKRECKVCGLTEVIECTGHDIQDIDALAPTCVEKGYTSGVRCVKCGIVYEGLDKLEPTGHTPETVEVTEATCTEDGYSPAIHCATCGELIEESHVLTENGHVIAVKEGYPATCQETGLTDEYYCSECGEILDEAEEIPLADHDYVSETVPATCTEDGYYTGEYCFVCGWQHTDGYTLEATGHDWITEYEGYPATCYEDGLEAYIYCANCGEILSDGSVIPHGHNLTHFEYKAPTEYEDGNIEFWYCYDCDTCFLDEEATIEIPFEDTVLRWGETTDTDSGSGNNNNDSEDATPITTNYNDSNNDGEIMLTSVSSSDDEIEYLDDGKDDDVYIDAKDDGKDDDTVKGDITTPKVPQTSDRTNVLLWVIVIIACVVILIIALTAKGKNPKDDDEDMVNEVNSKNFKSKDDVIQEEVQQKDIDSPKDS